MYLAVWEEGSVALGKWTQTLPARALVFEYGNARQKNFAELKNSIHVWQQPATSTSLVMGETLQSLGFPHTD